MSQPTQAKSINPILRLALVLTSGLLLTNGLGCALIEIPSYRLEDEASAYNCAQQAELCHGPLPHLPLPGWLARWKAEKDLPKPPDSPRFHPLPTRPMFRPAPATVDAGCFGELPAREAWNLPPAGQIQSQMLPAPQ